MWGQVAVASQVGQPPLPVLLEDPQAFCSSFTFFPVTSIDLSLFTW